jgi:HlyD family secretion protein
MLPPRKYYRFAILLVGLLAVAAASWWGLGRNGIAQPASPLPSAQGRVEGASDVLSLGTSATGTVAELLVAEGAHVKAGQHLVRIECSAVERELEARKSDLQAAEAVLTRVVKGPRPEEIAIGIANVNLAIARSEEADKTADRAHRLRAGYTVTQVQIDQAERDSRIAAALLDEVRAKLDLLRAGSRQEDIDEAHARRDAAEKRVAESATRLGYCSVDAPIDGVVLNIKVSPGQFVSAMVPVTLVTMVDDARRRVRTFVDERETAKLCLHQRARIVADTPPGVQTEGTVDNIGFDIVDNPIAGNPSRPVRQVTLALPDSARTVPIGLRVSVQFLACPDQNRP